MFQRFRDGYTLLKEHMTLPRYLPLDEATSCGRRTPTASASCWARRSAGASARRGRLEVVALRPPFILFEDFHAEIAARVIDPENYDGPVAGAPRAAGGGPWFHYVEPEDVARAFWLALELADVSFDVFFVSAATTYAPAPTLQIVERFFGELPDVTKPEVYRDNPFAPLFRSRSGAGHPSASRPRGPPAAGSPMKLSDPADPADARHRRLAMAGQTP